MDSKQTIASTPASRFDALLVIVTFLLFTTVPLLSPAALKGAAIGIGLLAVIAWRRRCLAAFPLGIFCGTCILLILLRVPFSQLWLGFGLIAYGLLVRLAPWLRGTTLWIRRGEFGKDIQLLCAAAGLVAAIALVGWYLLFRPNIVDIVHALLPSWPLGFIIAGGLLFSIRM